jgi:glycosyltransferase involved in cell wall biosynthesis
MEKLSVAIITLNEERNIGRCIDSVKNIADEIIVLDSFSGDKTVEIARSKGAKVIQQAFAGYIEQKNDAIRYTSNNYVLCLDADEALDEPLQQSIMQIKNNFTAAGYTMNRCTWYCNKFIRHGSWYPDRKLRLFNKSLAKWGGINPHDKVVFHQPQKTTHIKGDILHYSYNSLEEHEAQNNKFSTIAAESYWQQGKKTGLLKIIVSPCWAFLNSYLFRLGFLDGLYGFIIARNIAQLTFLKHSKLYLLQKKKYSRNRDPAE